MGMGLDTNVLLVLPWCVLCSHFCKSDSSSVHDYNAIVWKRDDQVMLYGSFSSLLSVLQMNKTGCSNCGHSRRGCPKPNLENLKWESLSHTHSLTHTHSHTHAHTHTHTHSHTLTHTLAYIHTHAHTHTHTNSHTHMLNTHTHLHTVILTTVSAAGYIVGSPVITMLFLSLCSTTFGFIGDTALHTRITESFIKHCSWYFGLAPSHYTSVLDSKTSSSSQQHEREWCGGDTEEEDEDKDSVTQCSSLRCHLVTIILTERWDENEEGELSGHPCTTSCKHWSHDSHIVIMCMCII